jgi:hypothetical protein
MSEHVPYVEHLTLDNVPSKTGQEMPAYVTEVRCLNGIIFGAVLEIRK